MRVSGSDVEVEVVTEGVAVCEVELVERGVSYIKEWASGMPEEDGEADDGRNQDEKEEDHGGKTPAYSIIVLGLAAGHDHSILIDSKYDEGVG